MKVLHLSTFDRINGASIAAYRLHRGLLSAGVDSRMWVQNKVTGDPTVIGPGRGLKKYIALTRPWIDRLPLAFVGAFHDALSSPSWLPRRIAKILNQENPDVIHLHWVQGGFLPIRSIKKFKIPVAWTFHDQWALAGMRQIPFLNDDGCSHFYERWDERLKRLKTRDWPRQNILAVAPSRWMKDKADKSEVWDGRPVVNIANPIDVSVFNEVDKSVARRLLGLPENRKLILFGSEAGTNDPRKGFDLLSRACKISWEKGFRFDLVCLGHGDPIDLRPIKCYSLGWLHDECSLALAYSASDLVAMPTRVDNLPNTAVEAAACGRPIVACDVGGVRDTIEDNVTGKLCRPESIDDLSESISSIIDDEELRDKMGKAARVRAIEKFSMDSLVPKFLEMYEGLAAHQG